MRHPLWGTCLALLFIPLVVLGITASRVAAQATVSLRVQVIYAANEPGGVDSRLGGLAADLQRTFRYSMYQLLEAPQGTAALNQGWRAALPGDRWLEIVPTAIQEGQYTLAVRVLGSGGKTLVNTVVRLRRGNTVLVGGGPPYQKGVLIIAITVPR